MHLKRLRIAVEAPEPKATRSLCALLATSPPQQQQQDDDQSSMGLNHVMVYFHGFPDMAVHPTKLEFASRMPLKLAQVFLSADAATKEHNDSVGEATTTTSRAFVTFNFSGIPGSDGNEHSRFLDKRLSKEVVDAMAVCEYVASQLLSGQNKRLDVVGLSTGATIASLMRRPLAQSSVIQTTHTSVSIAVMAGLLDLTQGIRGDFNDQQWQDFDAKGQCLKEFYLPQDCPLPRNAVIYRANDWTSALGSQEVAEFVACQANGKIFLPLSRAYVDECLQGKLDIAGSVNGGVDSSHDIPFLVVHSEQDQAVPLANGQQLFEAASEPKAFFCIPKANHLLTNSRHLKLALRAILKHCGASSSS